MNRITPSPSYPSPALSAVCYLPMFLAALGLLASLSGVLSQELRGMVALTFGALPILIPLLLPLLVTNDVVQTNAAEALRIYVNFWLYSVLLLGGRILLMSIAQGFAEGTLLAQAALTLNQILAWSSALLQVFLLIVAIAAIRHSFKHPDTAYRFPLPLIPVYLLTNWLTFAFMYMPLLVLAVYSFNDSRYSAGWKGFTWKWYQSLLNDSRILTALVNSLIVALVAVGIAAVLGTLMAVGLARYHFPGKGVYQGTAYLPLIIPDISIAVATLVFLAAIAIPISGGLIQLSLGTVIAAHVVFCLSYVAIVVSTRLTDLNPHLEEAALDLGATPTQAFVRVLLPELMPAIVSGCLLAFVLSLDDFLIASFTAGAGSSTLPMEIFGRIRTGVKPDINALSVILILSTSFLFAVAEYLRYRSQQKRFGRN